MDPLARRLLLKLLHAGDRNVAGTRSREAALTASGLAEYRENRSLQAKEAFETTFAAAQAEGAVRLTWEGRREEHGFIKRVEIADLAALARFLGLEIHSATVERAAAQLQPFQDLFPVLEEVIARWSRIQAVRTSQATDVGDWLDAIRVIDYARSATTEGRMATPIREASARLFKDSKRIEKLVGPVDVLLCDAIEGRGREPAEVWQELGLYREEQPALLAGRVVVCRTRGASLLDAPYTGLPPASVMGLDGSPAQVLTIENLTTFHSEAKRRCEEDLLIIYTAGMPSPAWRAMYRRLLRDVPAGTPVLHWGDVDEGGFRIAARLAEEATHAGHTLQPWRMRPEDVPEEMRRKAQPSTLERMRRFAAAAGWVPLGEAVVAAGFTVEQESL